MHQTKIVFEDAERRLPEMARTCIISHLRHPGWRMFERLLRIARLRDFDDQNHRRFFVTVRPGFPDILQRHLIVGPELRVRTPLEDASTNRFTSSESAIPIESSLYTLFAGCSQDRLLPRRIARGS